MEGKGRGYIGQQMSRNAASAYSKGEKPLSKWTKSEILKEISEIFDYNENEPEVDFGKLRLQELKDNFLLRTAWHHTGALYNATNFYGISENLVLNFTKEDFAEIIGKREPRKASGKVEKSDKDIFGKSDETLRKLNVVYNSGVTGLKTLNGLVRKFADDRLELESTFNSAVKQISKQDVDKVRQWSALPDGHWRKEYSDLFFKNPDAYAIKQYGGVINRRTGIYKKIKDKVSEER